MPAIRRAAAFVRGRRSQLLQLFGHTGDMEILGYTIAVVMTLAMVGAFFYVFLWAARKDGEADLATQRKLGFRRKTPLGL